MSTSFTPPRMYRCTCGRVIDHEPFDGRCSCGRGDISELTLEECYQVIAEDFVARKDGERWVSLYGPDQGRA